MNLRCDFRGFACWEKWLFYQPVPIANFLHFPEIRVSAILRPSLLSLQHEAKSLLLMPWKVLVEVLLSVELSVPFKRSLDDIWLGCFWQISLGVDNGEKI